jgi:hypothetical protein
MPAFAVNGTAVAGTGGGAVSYSELAAAIDATLAKAGASGSPVVATPFATPFATPLATPLATLPPTALATPLRSPTATP